MNRIIPLEPAAAAGETKRLFDGVRAQFGTVPNLLLVLGHAPVALESFLRSSATLARGTLQPKVREQIALAVAETNLCGYSLSAHSVLGAKAGLTSEEMAEARRATAASEDTNAVLKLARSLVIQRGELGDADLQAARRVGLTDGDIVETVANVALNIFSNYVNHVAQTAVDFPVVKPGHDQPTLAPA